MNSAVDTLPSPNDQCLIELDDVSMRWPERHVLDHINLKVNRGDFMVISGPNGGGKTTLLRIMLRLLKPTSGTVTYGFTEKNRIGYLPQKNMIDSYFPITVSEVVSSGLLAASLTDRQRKERVDHILSIVGLTSFRHFGIGQLSGGQLQRTLLGRAIISDPELLVLDEPLSYIDQRFEHRLYRLLQDLSEHTTIVLVSHQLTALSEMANRLITVDHTLRETL